MAWQLLVTRVQRQPRSSLSRVGRVYRAGFLLFYSGKVRGSPQRGCLYLLWLGVGGADAPNGGWRVRFFVGGFDSLPVISPTGRAVIATFKPRAQVECAWNGFRLSTAQDVWATQPSNKEEMP